MLAFDEAQKRLLALARALGPERVPLEAADGRVLFEDIRSTIDLPGAPTSAMDGYAVASGDIGTEGTTDLRVLGESRPGAMPEPLAPNTASRIFTGGIVPDGADAVVLQESVERHGDVVRIAGGVRAGDNVRRRGEDLASGALAFARGTRLTPTKIGLLASLDHAWVVVARRPVVTVLSTGDELRLPGSPPRPGSIPESGSITVCAMAKRAGAHAVIHPLVPDDPERTASALESALRTSDLVVTIGGMSEGEHDLVRAGLATVGAKLDFWKVAIKPGKPLGVATRGDAIALGLPGNPAAAVVTFALFGVPLLRALEGDASPVAARLRARLTIPVKHKPGRLEFVRATLSRGEDGTLLASPLAHQSSGSVPSVAHADALVAIPEAAGAVEAGASVDVYPFSEFGG
jgi:molybdopterin molybdotransferase